MKQNKAKINKNEKLRTKMVADGVNENYLHPPHTPLPRINNILAKLMR